MISVRPFQIEDREILRAWLRRRRMEESLADCVPETGMIVSDTDGPLAMGFLREIEACNCMMLDGLISNPDRQSRKTSYALDAVVLSLEAKAKALGKTDILATTVNKYVLVRGEQHAFERLPHAVMVKNLRERELCHL